MTETGMMSRVFGERIAAWVCGASPWWLAAGVLLCPLGVAAQDGLDLKPEVVTQFTQLIRWSGVFSSVFVIAGAWLLLRFTGSFVDQLSHRFVDRRLTFQKVETVFQFVVYMATAGVVITLSLRLDEKVLAVVGGTVAVSVGFAVKDVVASFIAGLMIMIDRPFQVGDRVSFGGQYGDITAIGLRSVRMQTLDDNTVTIPNNKFLSEIVSCGNYGALDMQVVMDFYVGLDQDIDTAREAVYDAAVSSRFAHLPKPVVVLVNQVVVDTHIAVRLRLKAYVLDTRYEKDFESDVNLRVLRTLRAHNILPPAILHRSI